jgi:hypothetical protein
MKTIDVTPTWTAILPILLEFLKTPQNRESAVQELRRMADAADKWNEHVKAGER